MQKNRKVAYVVLHSLAFPNNATEQNLPNVSTSMLALLGSVKAGCSTTQVTVLSLFIIRGKRSTLIELVVPLG